MDCRLCRWAHPGGCTAHWARHACVGLTVGGYSSTLYGAVLVASRTSNQLAVPITAYDRQCMCIVIMYTVKCVVCWGAISSV